MAPTYEVKNLADPSSETKKFIIIISVFIITAIGCFVYFYESLWLLINIIVSVIVAVLISFGVMALICLSDKSLGGSEGGNLISGISFLVLGIILFSGIRSCFYASPEERDKKLKLEQIEAEADRQHTRDLLQREANETTDFAKSNDEFKIYGTSDNQQVLLSYAEQAIKRFAHDPGSVTDVQALTPSIRLRMKQFPQCRYALQVQYRAKNIFGALVLENAVILFDRELNAFQILEKSPF